MTDSRPNLDSALRELSAAERREAELVDAALVTNADVVRAKRAHQQACAELAAFRAEQLEAA